MLSALNSHQPIADGYGITIPHLRSAGSLTHPAVTSAIIGVKKPEHMKGIAPAADGVLSARDWWQVAGVIAGAK